MRNPWKLSTLAFAAAAALAIGSNTMNTAGADPQPAMRNAITSLEAALGSLNKATPDKGGHRLKAIDLTKQAIEEVKEGIKFDNNH
jgi:hypothetical protein